MNLFRVILATAVFGAPVVAAAQVLPAPPAINPVERLAPQAPVRLAPNLEGPPLREQTGPGSTAEVRLGRVTVTGNEAMDGTRLSAALSGLAGAQVPLARIEEARLGILRAYRDAGYPFASVAAGLTRRPDGGADLTYQVTEGFVAEVKLEGDIGPAGTQVLRFLNRVVGQRPVSTAAIERALLLASDVPGVTVRGTLRPLQSEPGALQLVAQVERRAVSGYFNLDNRGYRNVGPWQGLLVAGLNSVTEYGERTELSLFGAQNNTQWFGQGSVDAFVGGSGLRLRVYGGAGITQPSGTLRQLGYTGESQVAGVGATYPLIRSRPVNLYLTAGLDMFDNTILTGDGAARARTSRDQVRTLRFGAEGQLLESFIPLLPAATTTGNVRIHHGVGIFGATPNGTPDSARRGNENFGFTKVTGEVQRIQPIFSPFEGGMISLQGMFTGQWSDDILPQSEKFFLGGGRLGRGYYAGQVTGDRAWGAAFELQLDTGYEIPVNPAWGGNRFTTQIYAFRDISRAFENLPTDPSRRLSSWGGGVRHVISDAVQFDVEAIHREIRRPDGVGTDRLRDTQLIFRTLVRF
jgi:hemolysin activation/secretion protein